MLTENADCKREATGKIFPVYRNIFGVPRATNKVLVKTMQLLQTNLCIQVEILIWKVFSL